MNKCSIALAVACLISAASAQAQAQKPAPTDYSFNFYGIYDEAVRRDSNSTSAGAKVAFADGMVSTSRLGVKGSATFANSQKLNLALEMGLKPATGRQGDTAALFDRKATLGMEGDWGKVDIGRDSTFGWEYTPFYDPLGGALAQPNPVSPGTATTGTLVNGSLFTTNNPYSDTKLRDNNVKYVYKASNGFIYGVDYSLGGTAGSSRKNAGKQVMLAYDKNSLQFVATIDQLTDANNLKQEVTTVGGNYKFSSQVKVTVFESKLKADAGFTPTANKVSDAVGAFYNTVWGATLGGKAEFDTKGFGVDYKINDRIVLTPAYYTTTVTATGATSNTFKTMALLGKYDLPEFTNSLFKRTFAYAAIDKVTAEKVSTTTGPTKTSNGKDHNYGITVGIQTRF